MSKLGRPLSPGGTIVCAWCHFSDTAICMGTRGGSVCLCCLIMASNQFALTESQYLASRRVRCALFRRREHIIFPARANIPICQWSHTPHAHTRRWLSFEFDFKAESHIFSLSPRWNLTVEKALSSAQIELPRLLISMRESISVESRAADVFMRAK
jgi:hypothetical protein